jgi:mono/diheme cytochrome c family protein
MKTCWMLLVASVSVGVAPVRVEGQAAPATRLPDPLPAQRTGRDVYQAACVTCHGADGTGSSKTILGFDAAPPDFTDCAFATAEPDPDWEAVVHEGGPVRGLDRHMPAFGDALSPEDIKLAVGHLRTFCTELAWPRGDLNLPRAFFTEKAFPENESLWVTRITRRGATAIGNDLIYERRLGPRNQVEIIAPLDFLQAAAGGWNRGLGDIALAFKRALYASIDTGGIGSAGLEVIMPTGKEALGLGNGYWVFEPFVSWGQILPRNWFLQAQGGAELPSDSERGATEVFLRASIGAALAQDRGFGRAWSPQVEVLWARPEGGSSEWDVVPQIQVSLSKLQHVLVAGGVRIPLTERDQRPTQALVYLLWDWFDGGFFEFWK